MSQLMQESIKNTLTRAIEELNVFTTSRSSRLTLGENGCLVAVKNNLFHRIFGFARPFLGFSLSHQEHQEQKIKIKQLRERILRLREIIQTHYPLIESFQKGTQSERDFAAFALKTIQRYNEIVVEETPLRIRKLSVSEDPDCLLLDKEIKGYPIISHQIKGEINFLSSIQSVHKILKELTAPASYPEILPNAIHPIHKKNNQFIIDSFRIKARTIMKQEGVSHSSSSIKFVEGEIEIEEQQETGRVKVEQHLTDPASGSVFVLSAYFQLPSQLEAKFMPIPTLLEMKCRIK